MNSCVSCHHGNKQYKQDTDCYDSVECFFPYSLHDENWHDVKHEVIRGRWHKPEYLCCNYSSERCYSSW